MATTRVVTKQLAGLEDMALGTGSVVQARASGNQNISKVSGSTLPWADNTLKTIAGVLASILNGEGASLIGVEDSAGSFTGTKLEAILAELHTTIAANTALIAIINSLAGAASVGITDSGGNFTAVNVETALLELFTTKAASGANSDITSLLGLTTALSYAQGGTGLIESGAVGNVVTSLGVGLGWQSSPGTSLIADGSIEGKKMSTAVQSTGSQLITSGNNWVPPDGEYQLANHYYHDTANDPDAGGLVFQLLISSIWRGGAENDYGTSSLGGLIRCDGANMRILNTSGADITLYYQKL